jgi:hypothetical protein
LKIVGRVAAARADLDAIRRAERTEARADERGLAGGAPRG